MGKKDETRLRLKGFWKDYRKQLKSLSREDAENIFSGMGYSMTTEQLIERDKSIRRLKSALKQSNNKYNSLLTIHERIEQAYNDLLVIDEPRPRKSITVEPGKSVGAHAAAILQWSDWHVGEVVDPETVFGLNEYNPGIADYRANALAVNSLNGINTMRAKVDIKTLVIHLGGDFCGGWIHSELEQTNSMSPIEEVMFSSDLIIRGLDYFLKEGEFDKIILLCSRGNHGRSTKKMQFANATNTNYETFIYNNIEKAYRLDDRVELHYPKSNIGYYDLFGYTIRFYHGQEVKYNGGVGGITVSLNRKQARWDETKRADINLMGHFHNLSYPNTRTVLNGSLKGFDAFAGALGFGYQPPAQALTLLDSEFGITMKDAIFCDRIY